MADEHQELTLQFEEHRDHLEAVAYRMLGSKSEADDAVQEAWIRLSRSDVREIQNIGGWLTTVTARICLDALRSRKARREEMLLEHDSHSESIQTDANPEDAVIQADSIGIALLVILETLTPTERLAFVLHDMFGVSFDEIALIVDRTPTATRQLASRARRRVQGKPDVLNSDQAHQKKIVEAFLGASRNGNFEALLAVLDPSVVVRADAISVEGSAAAAHLGAPLLASKIDGAHAVANAFVGRAKGSQLALVDGVVGATFAPGGKPRTVFCFTIEDDKVVSIELFSDADRIAETDIVLLDS